MDGPSELIGLRTRVPVVVAAAEDSPVAGVGMEVPRCPTPLASLPMECRTKPCMRLHTAGAPTPLNRDTVLLPRKVGDQGLEGLTGLLTMTRRLCYAGSLLP